MFNVNNVRSGVFIVNIEHISHLVLVFLLLTLNMQFPAGLISIIKIYVSEVHHELLNGIRFTILGNQALLKKSQIWAGTQPNVRSPLHK